MDRNRAGISIAAAVLSVLGAGAAFAQTADLTVTKEAAESSYAPGDTIVYTIEVSNAGPNAATAVVLNDSAPGLTLGTVSGACASLPCDLGSIAASTSKTVTISFTIPVDWDPPTAVTNYAWVTAATTDPDEPTLFFDADAEVVVTTPVEGINCGNLAVSGGDVHSCAIVAGNGTTLDDDLVECWGANFGGESIPPSGFFRQVSSGYVASCGVREDGLLECWGDDYSGILSNTPGLQGGASEWVQVDVDLDHACAVDDIQRVYCWGGNFAGKATAPADFVTQVAVGQAHSCALKTNGTIQCWGQDSDLDGSGDPIVTGVPSGTFVQVAAGGLHACARRADGSVDCWGTDLVGETDDKTGPFVHVTAGAEHNCGLRANGLVECWGGDDLGQVSTLPAESFDSIDAGSYHTCGILGDGDILCWGSNIYLQSLPPARSDQCPICLDGIPEGEEDPACDIAPPGTPPVCCSPVSCRPYRQSENQVCRPGISPCDLSETCDGINLTCPPDTLAPANTVCRLKAGSCDVVEVCDGSAATCPPELPMVPAGTLCRANAGSCDFEEFCDGSSALCPTDVVKVNGTLCRGSAGVCDVDEFCTGSSGVCPANVFLSGNTCRGTTGVCDVAEVCPGTQADCPADAVASVLTMCRSAVGVCDQQENCDSSTKDCPADEKRPSVTPCRAATGGCDVVERCTGTTNTCPADAIAIAGTTCRAAVSVCDVAETCLGTGKDCPADLSNPVPVLCRAAVDVCDVAENCTGSTPTCPANEFAPSGTECDDNEFCNGADTCNGSGACAVHTGDPCPGPDGDGNCAESCNEAADNCSTNDPNGSECSDGDPCSTGETCTNGTCGGGSLVVCNDDDICTFDTCDEDQGCIYLPGVADTGCLEPGAALLLIRDSAVPGADLLKWKWKKGEVIPPAELGQPTLDTDYTLCLFDSNAGEDVLVGSYRIPADPGFWKTKATKVKYINKDATVEGIQVLKAKSVALDGKSSAGLKAGGLTLDLPDPVASNMFFFRQPSFVAQLRNEAGMCLSTEFPGSSFKKNDGTKVKAVR